jgi:hypothetical protein
MNLLSIYWFALIKLCRLLIAFRLNSAAEWLGHHSGLKARLQIFLEEPNT